jgi:hypothetical protein
MTEKEFDRKIWLIATSLSKSGEYKGIHRHKMNLLSGRRLPHNIKEAKEWEELTKIPKESWCYGIKKWARENLDYQD